MDRNSFDFTFGVILSLIVCFGVFGNMLSFVIWTNGRRCKKCPGGLFLRALDLADTFVLVLCATDKAMALLGMTRLRKVNTFFCKLHKAGWHFGLLVSTWIVVCFTVERTIALSQPRKASKWTSRGKTIGILIFIFITSLLLNLPWAIGSEIMTVPDHIYVTVVENVTNITNGNQTFVEISTLDDFTSVSEILVNTTRAAYRSLTEIESDLEQTSTTTFRNITGIIVNIGNTIGVSEISFSEPKQYCGSRASSFISRHEKAYHFWFIDFVLIFSIPFTIIFCCNTAILLIVIWRRQKTQIRRGSLIQNVTARAVAVSLVHCISTGPFTMSILVPGFYKNAFILRTGHQYYVGVITVVCSYINNGVNFILYSFFGSDFRRDCADLIRRKSRVVPSNRSTISTTRKSKKRPPFQVFHRSSTRKSYLNTVSDNVPSVSIKLQFPSSSNATFI